MTAQQFKDGSLINGTSSCHENGLISRYDSDKSIQKQSLGVWLRYCQSFISATDVFL